MYFHSSVFLKNKCWIFLFFLCYSCQSNILFVSTSNSFCNKGFQNLFFLWGNIKGWNKQGRWLYIILLFQILLPSYYKLHAGILLHCTSDMNKIKETLISYTEQVRLWCKCWRRVKNDLIFEENIMCSENAQI